jgi:hypothetical protein
MKTRLGKLDKRWTPETEKQTLEAGSWQLEAIQD